MQFQITRPAIDLTDISEVDMIKEMYNRGIDIEYIQGAYYSLDEMVGHRCDELFGYSEAGLHGRQSDMPKKSKLPKDETGDKD